MRIKALLFYGMFAVALAVGISWLLFNRPETEVNEPSLEDNSVIARVNGVEIHALELNDRYLRDREDLISDPQALRRLQKIALDQLILERLILQDARKQNITVEPGEVIALLQNQYSSVGEEAFLKQLEEHGISLEQFKDNLENELVINKYNDALINRFHEEITVTAEEVSEYYETHKNDFDISSVQMLLFEVPPPRDQPLIDRSLELAVEAANLLKSGKSILETKKEIEKSANQIRVMQVSYPLNSLSSKERELVNELEPGEFTDNPVWITNSYRLMYRVDEKYQTISDVRSFITDEFLIPQKILDARQAHLMTLREEADIEVLLK